MPKTLNLLDNTLKSYRIKAWATHIQDFGTVLESSNIPLTVPGHTNALHCVLQINIYNIKE